jgi:hypothetical protein
MRSSFAADWAFGIVGAIEKIIRRAFPSEIRRWPVLQAFNFEAYSVGPDYFVIILRDKLSGIPVGPGTPLEFPHKDYPPLPVSQANINQWLSYLARKFELRSEDVAMVLPIHDSGQSSAVADFDIFNSEERRLWDHELNYAIARQMTGLKVSPQSSPSTPVNVTYNVSGTNARVNINSNDSSININSGDAPEILNQLIAAIRAETSDVVTRSILEAIVEEMKTKYGTPHFLQSYTSFMSVLADHMQVFGPIVAPFLPALAKLLA